MATELCVNPKGVAVCIHEDGETLPLVIRPVDENKSPEFLKTWIAGNKQWLDEKLLEHGAILLEGFDVNEGIEFQEVIQSFNPDLSAEYRGTSPRKLIPGTEYVFSASEFPSVFPVPQHIEMAFLPAPPRQLFFCCLEAPESLGGETPLCDFRKVYQQMDPEIRKQFEEKGVVYIRNYHAHKKWLSDPTSLKGWSDLFGTEDKTEVEAELRKNKLDFTWTNGDGLRIINKEAAVETHPVSGDKVWFNHVQVFHSFMMPDEFYRLYKRLGGIKYRILSWLTWFLKLFLIHMLGPMKVGFHTCFADGTEIPERYMTHIHDVIWKNMVFNRWKIGNILMIDNFRISHGRQPYSGKRKVVVSWSEPYLKPSHRT